MKKILYIHGLGGCGDGRFATILRNNLSNYTVDAPEIPINPKEALEFIKNIISNNNYDLVIGSSLGAYYLMTCGYSPKKFLVNPAINASEYIDKYIGKGTYEVNSVRQDGVKEYTIDDNFIMELKNMESITLVDDEEYLITRCAVSPEDELFGDSNAKLCKELYGDHAFLIHSAHRVEDKIIIDELIPKIKEFIEEDIFSAPIVLGPFIE